MHVNLVPHQNNGNQPVNLSGNLVAGTLYYPKFTGLLTRRYGPLQDDCPVNLDNQKFMARVNMQHKCKIMSYHEIYRIFVLQKIVVHFVRLNQYVVAPHRETPAVGNNIA